MNLEDIEQKTLAYLKQVGNPIVRIDVLFDHLARELELGGFSRADLTRFLHEHALFRVLDPVAADDDSGRMLRDAGFLAEPSVILATRMPTRDQIAATMVEQLDRLGEALVAALQEAREAKNTDAENTIRDALDRASALRRKVIAFHAEESGGSKSRLN